MKTSSTASRWRTFRPTPTRSSGTVGVEVEVPRVQSIDKSTALDELMGGWVLFGVILLRNIFYVPALFALKFRTLFLLRLLSCGHLLGVWVLS